MPSPDRSNTGETCDSNPVRLDYASGRYSAADDWEYVEACILCGALLCVPFFTGILAIIFARQALWKTRTTQRHKVVTFAGLTMGILNVLLWSAVMLWPS